MTIHRRNKSDAGINLIHKTEAKKRFLASILERSVNPAAINEILRLFDVEKTLSIDDPDRIASWANYRVDEIKHNLYILCPVPFLYDPNASIEAGFAIDASRDYFVVYPYLHDQASGASIVLQHLPHCVHAAIKLDATDYKLLSSEVIGMSNEASAIFFISNLINDLAVGLDCPVEFFDSRLYLQLITRLTEKNIPGWNTMMLASLRFKHLVRQYQELDPASEMHENNLSRVLLYMDLFLFGDMEISNDTGFVSRVDVTDLRTVSPVLHRFLVRSNLDQLAQGKAIDATFMKNQILAMRTRLKPPDDVIRQVYAFYFSKVKKYDGKTLVQILERTSSWTGENLPADMVQDAFSLLVIAKKFDMLEDLSAWTGIVPRTEITRAWYKAILKCRFLSEHDKMIELDKVYKVTGLALDEGAVRAMLRALRTRNISPLDEFTGRHMVTVDGEPRSCIDREIIISNIDTIIDENIIMEIPARSRFFQTNLLQWIRN